jgi:hypothetical protein
VLDIERSFGHRAPGGTTPSANTQGGVMSDVEVAAPAAPYTGAGLVEFLDTAATKGWVKVNSAKALKTASIKILSVEGGWENLDLRSLDVDGLFERFRNLKHNEYSDESMRIYRTRLTQAVRMYVGRLDNDPTWRSYGPSPRAGASGSDGKKRPAKTASTVAETADETPVESPSRPPYTAPKAGLMEFPFPLRDNVDVFLRLPRDLTNDEAARLSGFIASLARTEARPTAAGAKDQTGLDSGSPDT